MTGRMCILLQGPVGGFFSRLKQSLRDVGFAVIKINFNGGDVAFGTADDIDFDLPPERFGAWFRALLKAHPSAVVLGFGDERGPHRIARDICRDAGIPILFFEEGYLRPGFVALERGGNNASSAMRWLDVGGHDASTTTATPVARTGFRQMAASATLYWIAMRRGRGRFPHYRHHYEPSLLREGAGWIALAATRATTFLKARAATAALLAPGSKPFALLLLQLDTDLQIRAHGRGWTAKRAIETAISSFAAHAEPAMTLVVKSHPLERRRDLGRALTRSAARLGIKDRVVFLNQGSLPKLLSGAKAVVTVNSTGGLRALEAGVPVFTLGNSIYSRRGLARTQSDGKLDLFWNDTRKPDRRTWTGFRARLINDVLLPGSFYDRATWQELCRGVANRLREIPLSLAKSHEVEREREDA